MKVLSSRRSIGGVCQWCRRPTRRGATVYRISDGRPRAWSVKDPATSDGGTTAGSWLCEACAELAGARVPLPGMEES